MAKAFISSTGRDLAEYREAAIRVCNELQIVPIAMEFFEAMGAGATEGSKRAVADSEVYIGIFAHRYGFIEPGYDRSVTEIEFESAEHMERLCFVVEPTSPWNPDLIEHERRAELEAFKRRVETSLIRARFTTVDDFRAKLLLAVTKWQERHGMRAASARGASDRPRQSMALLPPRPALLIGRDGDFTELSRRLGLVGGAPRPLTIVRGWPGVGKTTLVNALAHDPAVQRSFPDGVLSGSLGEKAEPYAELLEWIRELGESGDVNGPEKIISKLRSLLLRRRVLLIVDDAWRSEDAIPFKDVRGPGCALLMTTRFGDVARALAVEPEDVYVLAVLSDDAALDLLRRVSPTVVKQHPAKAHDLIHELEGLPLAIRVAGRLLEGEASLGVDVEPLISALRESYLILGQAAPDDRFDPETGVTPTINLLFKQSTDRLDEETRERFGMLGVFAPKPATFDLDAMAAVWQVADALPSARVLVDRGLLEPIVSQGRFQMHAVLVKHAQSLLQPS